MKLTQKVMLSAALLGLGAVPAQAQLSKAEMKEHLDQMKAQLKLSPQQEDQVKAIFTNMKKQIDQACDGANDQVNSVLNDQQKPQYKEMYQQWEKQHDVR